jgi:hypothetical protein
MLVPLTDVVTKGKSERVVRPNSRITRANTALGDTSKCPAP